MIKVTARNMSDILSIETIFKKSYKPLCLYALHYLGGDLNSAEDVVQDCFVKLWEHEPKNQEAYLYTAVRNACIDILRKSTLNTDIEPSDLESIITDDEAKLRSQKEARLWTAIDNLPEKCRRIFLMSKRDGMKYREIAEELCISEKTVEHQISKAMKRLHSCRDEILFVMFMIF